MKRIILMLLVIICALPSFAFASSDELDSLSSTRSYPISAEEFFGEGWRMTRSPVVENKYFDDLDPTSEKIRATILYVINKIPFVDNAIYVAELDYIQKKAERSGTNGIFSKTYYLAKPVRSELEDVNVPVACYVKYVTIFYENNSQRITKYLTDVESMESPNVQNIAWYKLESPNTDWRQ